MFRDTAHAHKTLDGKVGDELKKSLDSKGLKVLAYCSTRHRFQMSNPRLAVKQGLLKMKALADAGFPQAVIPPHERPF
ncbi:N-succinylarginine dihydrolase, partial [Salmonella enterica subsp. enterica serovar Virginia]|nr:N-succinylarginine dihydrolase [Salmonella enterica subsp. enterica serovar Virginia]